MMLREAWEAIGITIFANLQKHKYLPSLNILWMKLYPSLFAVDGLNRLSRAVSTPRNYVKGGGKQLNGAAASEDQVKTSQRRSRGHHFWSPS
jgi:hypothetical protein